MAARSRAPSAPVRGQGRGAPSRNSVSPVNTTSSRRSDTDPVVWPGVAKHVEFVVADGDGVAVVDRRHVAGDAAVRGTGRQHRRRTGGPSHGAKAAEVVRVDVRVDDRLDGGVCSIGAHFGDVVGVAAGERQQRVDDERLPVGDDDGGETASCWATVLVDRGVRRVACNPGPPVGPSPALHPAREVRRLDARFGERGRHLRALGPRGRTAAT